MHFDLFINLLVFQRLIDVEVEAFWVELNGEMSRSLKSELRNLTAGWSYLCGLEAILGSPAGRSAR